MRAITNRRRLVRSTIPLAVIVAIQLVFLYVWLSKPESVEVIEPEVDEKPLVAGGLVPNNPPPPLPSLEREREQEQAVAMPVAKPPVAVNVAVPPSSEEQNSAQSQGNSNTDTNLETINNDNGHPHDLSVFDRARPAVEVAEPRTKGTKDFKETSTSHTATDQIGDLFNLLVEAKPKSLPLTTYKDGEKAAQLFSSDEEFHFSKNYLSNLLEVRETSLQDLKTEHQLYVSKMKALELEVFGDQQHKSINGEGVVIVGGGRFSWLALLNINQLRATGSELPVEVFIATQQEYEPVYCEEILPSLNARCLLGFKELPIHKFANKLQISGFQYKILAILASSFRHVLLLDADNVVMRNPEGLFEWNVYKEKAMVLWPDCWSRTTHPYYYEIAGIPVGDKPVRGQFMNNENPDEWNFHDLPGTMPNPTTESGMLLVDKVVQVETLLLVLYYNMYGPSYYYPLITQGGAGEGDKDTFVAAAFALNKPYYQVKQSMRFLGYHDDYGYHAKALGQWDPMTEKEERTPEFTSNLYQEDDRDDSRLMFMHLSYPKLYPINLKDEISWEKDGELHHKKLYPGELPNSDYGFDLRMWELMTQLICEDYEPNTLEPENPDPASVLVSEAARLSGLKLKYMRATDSASQCGPLFLPHLEYLRANRYNNEVVYRYD